MGHCDIGRRMQSDPVLKAKQNAAATKTLNQLNSDPVIVAANTARIQSRNSDPEAVAYAKEKQKEYYRQYRLDRGFNPDIPIGTITQRLRACVQPLTKAILHVDGYRCALCGTEKGRLQVHHIVPRSKSNIGLWTDPYNLISLCKPCHKTQVHQGNSHKEPHALLTMQLTVLTATRRWVTPVWPDVVKRVTAQVYTILGIQ